MRHTTTKTTILSGLLALLALTACSSDDTAGTSELTLDIPVEIYDTPATRAASQGDPGNDPSLKSPLYLYIFAYVKTTDGNGYELLTKTITPTDGIGDWTIHDEGTQDERWRRNLRVTFTINGTFDGTTAGTSRVYAIASRDDLSSIIPSDVATYTTANQIEAMTLDFRDLSSSQLKDIYSTPAKNTDNGIIKLNGQSLSCSTVKLYHAAAKVDFTWEVDASLQNGVALQSITCTSVPTICKIFTPTDNPTTQTADVTVLGSASSTAVNEGNKWIGRAYAYMLQQPSPGTLSYTVAFSGTANRPAVSKTFTPADYNDTYTGWYRVSAEVK